MVVETMTYKEIWSEINKDYKGIIQYKLQDADKILRKKVIASSSTQKIIRISPIRFKSKSTNLNHCLIPYCLGKTDYKKNGMLFVLYSYIYRKYGIYAFSLNGEKYETLNVYTPHLFSRYRERFLDDSSLKMEEVMEEFFINNVVSPIEEINNEKYPDSFFSTVKDGVLLGVKQPDNILEFKTFLSSELLRNQQIDLHNSQNEGNKKYLEEIYGTDVILQE